jgi:hypothetical protein
MAIIRAENGWTSPAQLALMITWGVKRCNVAGCKHRPNTIATGLMEDGTILGFCEEHYQQANVPGGSKFTLEFDDVDAFADEKAA